MKKVVQIFAAVGALSAIMIVTSCIASMSGIFFAWAVMTDPKSR